MLDKAMGRDVSDCSGLPYRSYLLREAKTLIGEDELQVILLAA